MRTCSHKLFTIAVLSSLLMAPLAHAQLRNYDLFTGNYLNANKWDFQHSTDVFESIRKIENRSWLRQRARTYADLDRTGGTRTLRQRMSLPETVAKDIRGMEMSVTVKEARVLGCPLANTTTARVRARLQNGWFADSNRIGAGSTGNVYSTVEARHSSDDNPGQLRLRAWIYRCDDENCAATSDVVPANANTSLGDARVGQTVTIGHSWDEAAQKIHYWARVPGSAVRRTSIDYSTFLTARQPTDHFRGHTLYLRGRAPHCDRTAGTGIKRPFALIDTRVHRVRLSNSFTRG